MSLTHTDKVAAFKSETWAEMPPGWELLSILAQRQGTAYSCMVFVPNTQIGVEALGSSPREAWNLACMAASKSDMNGGER